MRKEPTGSEYGHGFLMVQEGRPLEVDWELGTRRVTEAMLPNLDLFVNVGANIGFYTLMAQTVGVRTIAFEPEPINCQFFCKNMVINGFVENLELWPVAVGSPPPRILEIYGIRSIASLSADFRPSRIAQRVPVVALDDVVLSHRWMQKSLLVMIDVETWEQQVLDGAKGLLSLDPKPLWIIEVLPESRSQSQTFQTMWDCGYRAYRIMHSGNLTEVCRGSTDPGAPMTQGEWNYLFADGRLSLSEVVAGWN